MPSSKELEEHRNAEMQEDDERTLSSQTEVSKEETNTVRLAEVDKSMPRIQVKCAPHVERRSHFSPQKSDGIGLVTSYTLSPR